ncbi:MAG: hypothetical protein KIT68_09045 [Phycisphaeraceae bacterium]|nr:hypothetical protein [Phycisphaeraceae bacterium]
MILISSAALIATFLLGAAAPIDSAPPGDDAPKKPHARARLVLEHPGAPAGGEVWVGLAFDIDPQWHIYWPGQNDSGMPVTMNLTLPQGASLGQWRWPAPVRHLADGDILDHVYEGRVTIIAPLKIPATAKAGDTLSIGGEFDWLVCKTLCLPGSAKLSVDVKVLPADARPQPTADAPLFEAARKRLPRPAGGDVQRTIDGDKATLSVKGAASLRFYPSENSVRVSDLVKTGVATGDSITLPFERTAGKVGTLLGVLEVGRTSETLWYWIEAPIPAPKDK